MFRGGQGPRGLPTGSCFCEERFPGGSKRQDGAAGPWLWSWLGRSAAAGPGPRFSHRENGWIRRLQQWCGQHGGEVVCAFPPLPGGCGRLLWQKPGVRESPLFSSFLTVSAFYLIFGVSPPRPVTWILSPRERSRMRLFFMIEVKYTERKVNH